MTKIIVEVCQNHNGSPDLLGEMVKQAALSGADIVKMQSIFSSDLTNRDRFEEGEMYANGSVKTIKRPYKPECERLEKLDLTGDDHVRFIRACERYGVIPMTTIFANHRVEDIEKFPWKGRMVKVASYDCASFPFLVNLAKYFDHLIISTGATFDDEIAEAARLLKSLGKKFTFLHCVTSYPNEMNMCNLSRMEWLRKFTPEVGWSDHTLVERDGIMAAKIAVMLGADYIERHFTVLEPHETKDGPVSITPALLRELDQFRKLLKDEQKTHIEEVFPDWKKVIFGTPLRDLTQMELANRDYYRGRFASPAKSGGWVYNWE